MDTNNTITDDNENFGDHLFLVLVLIFSICFFYYCCFDFLRDISRNLSCKKEKKHFYVEPIENPPKSEVVPKDKIIFTRKTCVICMEVKYKMVERNCGHHFCRTCNDAWKEKSPACPLCREIF